MKRIGFGDLKKINTRIWHGLAVVVLVLGGLEGLRLKIDPDFRYIVDVLGQEREWEWQQNQAQKITNEVWKQFHHKDGTPRNHPLGVPKTTAHAHIDNI